VEQSVSNLELVKSDDTLSHVSGPFDMIHSFLVFQHINPKRGEKILRRLIELLGDKGIGVVQFVYYRQMQVPMRIMGILRARIPLLHNVVNLLYGKPMGEPLMEKNIYNLNRIVKILHEHNCSKVQLRYLGKGKFEGVVIFFRKENDTDPCDSMPHIKL